MSTGPMLDPTGPLAPSELVLLNGEKFASKVLLGNVDLLHSGMSVSATQLGQAILATALLANEQAGAIRLEIRKKKALFGLRRVDSLYAAPIDFGVAWPAHSLESEIQRLAKQLRDAKERNEVSSVIYAWLRQDSAAPWQSVVEWVKSGMASRGLLRTVEEKRLKILTVTHFELPESTASLAAQQSVEPIHQLLESCEKTRPEVWKMLAKQITAAIKARTEQQGADMDFD
jgi:hypothetical protein